MSKIEVWGYIFLFICTLLSSLSSTFLTGRWQIFVHIVAILFGILFVAILVPAATKN